MRTAYVVCTIINAGIAYGAGCGKWFSYPCKAKTDHRYMTEVSLDLKDQHHIWNLFNGFFHVKMHRFVSYDNREPVPYEPTLFDIFVNPAFLNRVMPYKFNPYEVFTNISVSGSRLSLTWHQILPSPDEEFCRNSSNSTNDQYFNVLGGGECGVNGYRLSYNWLGTSTYEKNGKVNFFQFSGGADWFGADPTNATSFKGPVGKLIPIDNRTIYYKAGFSATISFLDDNGNTASFRSTSGPFRSFSIGTMTRLSENGYADGLIRAMNASNVPMGQRHIPPCVDKCPNEADWCDTDPTCSISPYQEPDSSLNVSAVVLIVTGAAIFVGILMSCWYARTRSLMEATMKRSVSVKIANILSHVTILRKLRRRNNYEVSVEVGEDEISDLSDEFRGRGKTKRQDETPKTQSVKKEGAKVEPLSPT